MTKFIHVTMPDRLVWRVPAQVVADDRARYYAERQQGALNWVEIYDKEYETTLQDDDELLDWAANNMNWTDVVDQAMLVPQTTQKLTPLEWQEGWVNGPKQIIEEES